MRRVLTALLITLLAMRALVGDAMAYGMVQSAPLEAMTSAQNDSQQAMPHEASSMPCHTVAATTSDDATSAAHPACTTCQVSHLSAFLPAGLLPIALAIPSALPAEQALAWHSAERALVSKPPVL
jgi:hypothetical protein